MATPLLSGTPGQTHLLLGNEAIVRGAIEAGIQFISCYPGTPSSEVPDTFFRLSPEASYTFEYSVNEKVALEVGAGATLAGAMTLVTMKHVGVNVAADPLLTLAYTGTPGGFVLLSADDPGCHSSQNEQDNRIYARLAGLPCLATLVPHAAEEILERGGSAYEQAWGLRAES
jgi:indolepyruvate ferredoxin oxidoreductase alpha subunit